MKTLCLLRHAKASWKNNHMSDLERPLVVNGYDDIYQTSHKLKEQRLQPEIIITSHAKRAFDTAQSLSTELNKSSPTPIEIVTKPAIYEADVTTLLDTLAEINDDYQHVLLIGHNPGLSLLANYISEQTIQSLPPCGLICFTCPIRHWNHIVANAEAIHNNSVRGYPIKFKALTHG